MAYTPLGFTTFPMYSPLQTSSRLVSLLYSTRQNLKRKGPCEFLAAASGGMYVYLPWILIAEVLFRSINCKCCGRFPTSRVTSPCKINEWKHLFYEFLSRITWFCMDGRIFPWNWEIKLALIRWHFLAASTCDKIIFSTEEKIIPSFFQPRKYPINIDKIELGY